jgi:hypothetical protein
MPSKKLKKKMPVTAAKRKPTAPPSKTFGKPRVQEKIHPAGRKSKHKKSETEA